MEFLSFQEKHEASTGSARKKWQVIGKFGGETSEMVADHRASETACWQTTQDPISAGTRD